MSRRVSLLASCFAISCVSTIVLSAGCGVLPESVLIPPPVEQVSAEIKAVIADRASVEVKEDDPLYALAADQVGDDLSRLDGCWAGWTTRTSPADFLLIRQGQPIADTYAFTRFDAPTGQFVQQGYARNLVGPFGIDTYIAYQGTYAVIASNRVAFTALSMTTTNPATGRVFTLPDELDAYVADLTATEAGLTPADLELMRTSIIEQFTNPQPWESLVTIQGDRLKLTDVWTNADTGAEMMDTEDATVCVRFPCPG